MTGKKSVPVLNTIENSNSQRLLIGWRERVSLPELGIETINAKVDTGAKTSCLHTFSIKEYKKDGETWVRFRVHPIQDDYTTEQECHAKVKDRRIVRDSGGHESLRYVIETLLIIGQLRYRIEMTLTARDKMAFRMLLGRTAMTGRFYVDPKASYLINAPVGQK